MLWFLLNVFVMFMNLQLLFSKDCWFCSFYVFAIFLNKMLLFRRIYIFTNELSFLGLDFDNERFADFTYRDYFDY